MFKFKKVKIGRYFIGKITDLIFFIMQILHFYKEKRSDYGVEIFEYFYLPWKNDVEFNHIYQEVKNNTLNPKSRLYTIYSLAKKYLNEGDSFIEVGTWKGGVPALVSKISSISNLDIFACDTFNGVANASGNDTFFQNGEYSDTSTQIVADIVNTENCNLSIIEGVFPESFKINKFKKFSLAHIDVDTYKSAKQSFDFISNNLAKGGVIILDDFGGWFTDGVTKFGKEIIESKEYFSVPNHLGQLLIYKLN